MGRKNTSGLAWKKNAFVAETSIGTYVVRPAKGGADVFFERSALDRCKTADAAKARCEQHFNELKPILKPVAPSSF
jgi:hypothetical protein